MLQPFRITCVNVVRLRVMVRHEWICIHWTLMKTKEIVIHFHGDIFYHFFIYSQKMYFHIRVQKQSILWYLSYVRSGLVLFFHWCLFTREPNFVWKMLVFLLLQISMCVSCVRLLKLGNNNLLYVDDVFFMTLLRQRRR